MKRRIACFAAATLLALLLPTAAFAESEAFTETEWERIEASQTTPITVGVIDNSAPICYWNGQTHAYEGITIDMLETVSRKTGLQFTYIPVDLSRRAEATVPTDASPQLVVGVTD